MLGYIGLGLIVYVLIGGLLWLYWLHGDPDAFCMAEGFGAIEKIVIVIVAVVGWPWLVNWRRY